MIDVFFCSVPDGTIREQMAEVCLRRWADEPETNLIGLVLEDGDKRQFQRLRRIEAENKATTEFYILTDDDCLLETTSPYLERAIEIMRSHPDFALLSWMPINCDIIPWRPGPGEHKFLVNGTQVSDQQVMEHVSVGGIRLCRKGAMTDWPELPQGIKHYDNIHCAHLRELGWRSGYFRNLRQLHLGRHYSTLIDETRTDETLSQPEVTPTVEELESMIADAHNSALNAFCCLTLDDDDVDYWREVAITVEPYSAKITCFITTMNIRTQEEPILADLARRGHEMAVHSLTHTALTGRSAYFWKPEILGAAAWIESVTGHAVTSHAMPFGATSPELRAWLRTTPLLGARNASHRLQSISDADPYDIPIIDHTQVLGDGSEEQVRMNAKLIYDICRQNNALFVLCSHNAKEMTAQQAGWIVEEIGKNGGRFITFSDMLRSIRNQA